MPNFSGIWTVRQQYQAKGQTIWPATPGAPTIGTATGGCSSASVTFTAPSCAGYPATITGYQATSTPGCITATGSSSPISVTGLTNCTSYTFKVRAQNASGYGPCSAASNSVSPGVVGSQSYTTAGTYSWVAPAGVTKVSVVAVGAGGSAPQSLTAYGASGGGLGYKNNYSVTPGNSYTVVVGASTANSNGGNSYFVSACSVVRGGGGYAVGSTTSSHVGDGGGNGGFGGAPWICNIQGSSGGAAGYSGNGGNGAAFPGGSGISATAGSGGGGGGAGRQNGGSGRQGGAGGVGLFGQGCNGAAGTGTNVGCCSPNYYGKGGSCGTNGTISAGGLYGGGYSSSYCSGKGGGGAVRIVWPGNTRQFPSTNVGSP